MRGTRLLSLVQGLMALAVVPAVAFAAVDGARYSATIGPGYPMSFRVSAGGTEVTNLVVSFEETCNGAAGDTPPKFHFGTLSIRGGRFSGRDTDHFGSTVSDGLYISGRFSGRKATGKVSDTSKIKSLPSCTETEPFTATVK
jgi:hypothetical protein